MTRYYVYAHLNIITAKVYIGWAADPKQRWYVHCAAKDNTYFHRAIHKYGKECFECYIIANVKSRKEATQKEIEFIKRFNTIAPNGYNLTRGGEGSAGYWKGKKRPDVSVNNRKNNPMKRLDTKIKRLKNRLIKLEKEL